MSVKMEKFLAFWESMYFLAPLVILCIFLFFLFYFIFYVDDIWSSFLQK